MKHNKKRNTAFLFESLVKELTRATLSKNLKLKNVVMSILREHFHKDSILHKELTLYKTLCEISNVEKDIAEKIVSEVKRVYHSLGQQKIFDEQTEVIKKINSGLSKDIYKNFISNYKTLASISQLFSDKTPIASRVILETRIIEEMCSERKSTRLLKPMDNLTYNVFVKKFNDKYGSVLTESQKDLLSQYVIYSPDTVTEFKMYISDEISRLKERLSSVSIRESLEGDSELIEKSTQILEVLSNFKNEQINDGMIKKILKIQSLVSEL